jgi:hypothetical protein
MGNNKHHILDTLKCVAKTYIVSYSTTKNNQQQHVMDTLKYAAKILLVVVRSRLDFNVASQVSSIKN